MRGNYHSRNIVDLGMYYATETSKIHYVCRERLINLLSSYTEFWREKNEKAWHFMFSAKKWHGIVSIYLVSTLPSSYNRYYCLGNATSPTPEDGGVTGDPCLAGHYCPGPTTSSIPCEPGTYTTTTHRSECDVCPEGSYCITGYDPEPCPHGKSKCWFHSYPI